MLISSQAKFISSPQMLGPDISWLSSPLFWLQQCQWLSTSGQIWPTVCHRCVCVDGYVSVQIYFVILHDFQRHVSEHFSTCFLHNSQCTLLATLSCLLLYCFWASLEQSLTKCITASNVLPHLHLGDTGCLSIFTLIALVLNACPWAANSKPDVFKKNILYSFSTEFASYILGSFHKLSITCQYTMSTFFPLFSSLWILPLIPPLPSHSPSVLHSTYLPYFPWGSHTFLSSLLLYTLIH